MTKTDTEAVEVAISEVARYPSQSCGDFDCDAEIGEKAARRAYERFAALSPTAKTELSAAELHAIEDAKVEEELARQRSDAGGWTEQKSAEEYESQATAIHGSMTELSAAGLVEADVSIAARAIRQTMRDYGHNSADTTLPEIIAGSVCKALSAPTREREWQPIETAPKGPWIIGTDGDHVRPMAWETKCDDDEYTGWCGACTVDGGMLYTNHVELGFAPTHWQPLPEPPRIDNLLNEGSGR